MARAEGADEARVYEAEKELEALMEGNQMRLRVGLCLGLVFCPCTCGCSWAMCPACCVMANVQKKQAWSEKFPLIAVEVNRAAIELDKALEVQVPHPSLQAINRRRAELGLAPSQDHATAIFPPQAAPAAEALTTTASAAASAAATPAQDNFMAICLLQAAPAAESTRSEGSSGGEIAKAVDLSDVYVHVVGTDASGASRRKRPIASAYLEQ